MRRIKNILINIALFISVIIVCLFVFEIVFRILGISCSIVDEEGNGIYIISDDGFYMKPDYNGRFRCLEFDTPIQTNRDGYRDSEFNTNDKAILVLGDSFAFGHGVKQDETYADILEGYAHSKGFEVYNIGVPGYSPKEFITQLSEYLPKFNSKIVIVTLYEGNDAQENCGILNRTEFVGETRRGFGKVKDFLKKLYIVRFIEPLLLNLIDIGDSTTTSKQFYMLDEPKNVRECNRLLKESMKIMRDEAKSYNNDIVFLILPSKMNFIKSDDSRYDYNKKINTIVGFCSELKITCLNIKELIRDSNEIYLKEGHLNKEGHNKIAKLINDFLLKEGILENG